MANGEVDPVTTATAATSASPVAAAESLGPTLGRYRLERELGAGAMGVVHAAFDPDLERRIALKVLPRAAATTEARERLLREARAMARLTHPNVVTVHEVGTADGRDFVAMELIRGETLAEWLRQAKRPSRAILDAFLAAGRGLAAAHAAGIVHRDFKPHNVLRSRDGRIAVTDFGLAREAEGQLPHALDATLPVGAELVEPTPLVGITVTGSLLGTPAYMAPEQWRGGAVTPATDQFAYCVALWEALAGERPYAGPTLDDLRSQIARGPAALDASRIPRRLRGLLRRGLDPDPSRRWPSMDALLAQLSRGRRRPVLALAIAGGALAAAAVLVFALRHDDAPAPACEPPARDVATVWSPAIAAELGARTSAAHAAVLDAAFRDWQTARTAACTAPPQVRQAQLQCLDGVLARFDALRRAFARAPGGPAEALRVNLVDPAVCRKPAASDIPRLTLAPTPGVIAAFALLVRSETEHKPSEAEIALVAGASNSDPCARVIATLAFDASFTELPRARSLTADAAGAADQCGDERLRADLRIRDSPYRWELPMIGPRGEAAIEQAQIAAARVMQPELEAALAAQHLAVASQRGQWDDAFRLANTVVADYRARGLEVRHLRAVIARNELRLARTEPRDLEAVLEDVRTSRPLADDSHQPQLARKLDVQEATARFVLGDVAAGHASLVQLWRSQPHPELSGGSRRITGDVVDTRGRPVAGARVAAASLLFGDAVGIDLPASLLNKHFQDDLRTVTSDAAGHFVIEGAVRTGPIAAELADRRSMPAPIANHVRLVLEPTRSVSGRVDLAGMPHTQVRISSVAVAAPVGGFSLVAPVAPDGSFTVTGAAIGALRISVVVGTESCAEMESRTIPASSASVTGVLLSLPSSTRAIDVVVRSTVAAELGGAEILLLSGKPKVTGVDDLLRLPLTGGGLARPVSGDATSAPRPDQVLPGDLVLHLAHVRPGDLTVCAVNFSGDWLDPKFRERWRAHLSQLPFACDHIGPSARSVILHLPPQLRLE